MYKYEHRPLYITCRRIVRKYFTMWHCKWEFGVDVPPRREQVQFWNCVYAQTPQLFRRHRIKHLIGLEINSETSSSFHFHVRPSMWFNTLLSTDYTYMYSGYIRAAIYSYIVPSFIVSFVPVDPASIHTKCSYVSTTHNREYILYVRPAAICKRLCARCALL